jgi:hypothetical protein
MQGCVPMSDEDRPASRSCSWCGREFRPSGVGRIPTYCRRSCRQRAYEARQEAARTAAAIQAATPLPSRDETATPESLPSPARTPRVPSPVTSWQAPPAASDPDSSRDESEGFGLGAQVVLLVAQRGATAVHGRRVVYDLPVGTAGTVAEVRPAGVMLVEWDTGVTAPVQARVLHSLRPRSVGRAAGGA